MHVRVAGWETRISICDDGPTPQGALFWVCHWYLHSCGINSSTVIYWFFGFMRTPKNVHMSSGVFLNFERGCLILN